MVGWVRLARSRPTNWVAKGRCERGPHSLYTWHASQPFRLRLCSSAAAFTFVCLSSMMSEIFLHLINVCLIYFLAIPSPISHVVILIVHFTCVLILVLCRCRFCILVLVCARACLIAILFDIFCRLVCRLCVIFCLACAFLLTLSTWNI